MLDVVEGEAGLAERVAELADATRARAARIELLFVTNLRKGAVTDVGPDGVSNAAQYYTRRQADAIIRSIQELGDTVRWFLSELEFIAAMKTENRAGDRTRVVFTTAEGGSGAGRRALVPAVCNLLGLPCVNSGAHASSLARHKFHANAVLRRVGVRVPETWMLDERGWVAGVEPAVGSRVILKPTFESMCIGVDDDSVVVTGSDFAKVAAERARQFAQPVLVQEFVSGEEIGVPLLSIDRPRALPPVAFRRGDGTAFEDRPRTFHEEVVESSVRLVRFDGPPGQIGVVQHAAVKAFDALGMKGAARVDFRIDADGRPWAIDTNESPPPLAGTSYAVAMQALGFSVLDMLAAWLGACLVDANLLSAV